MRTTSRERAEVIARLIKLGISYEDAEALRRIAKTLRNWFELECGTERNGRSVSIERDENGDGKPWLRVQFGVHGDGIKWIDRRYPTPDREAGAKKRLAAIMAGYKRKLVPYVQGDPRGASLHILRKGQDLKPGDQIDSVYSRGVAVY